MCHEKQVESAGSLVAVDFVTVDTWVWMVEERET